MRGLFVTGTDTGVGKTVVSAALLAKFPHALYWKPIQTGTDDDTAEAQRLTPAARGQGPGTSGQHEHASGLAPGPWPLAPGPWPLAPGPWPLAPAPRPLVPGPWPLEIRLPDPVSPHLAAQRVGIRIDLDALTQWSAHDDQHWIVEGAGGVLVPVNETETMAKLMLMLALPVLVVARTTLGTINHTLLTLEALRSRQLTVAGVVMVGEPNADNRDAIEHYGRVPVAHLPHLDPLTPERIAQWPAPAWFEEYFA